MRPLRRAARSMLGATFVSGGITAMISPEKLEPQAKRVTNRIATLEQKYPKLPAAPTLIRLNGALQLAGGLLLATGRVRRTAALALAASMVPSTLAAHAFWALHDPAQRHIHRIHFLKNVSMFGGLLLAAVDTEGRPGLAWRAGQFARDTRRSARRVSRSAQRAGRGVQLVSRNAQRVTRNAQRVTRSAQRASCGARRNMSRNGMRSLAGWVAR